MFSGNKCPGPTENLSPQSRSKPDRQKYFDQICRQVWDDSCPERLGESKVGLCREPRRAEGVIDEGAKHQPQKQKSLAAAFLKKQAADKCHEDKSDEITACWSQQFSEAGTERGKDRETHQTDGQINEITHRAKLPSQDTYRKIDGKVGECDGNRTDRDGNGQRPEDAENGGHDGGERHLRGGESAVRCAFAGIHAALR